MNCPHLAEHTFHYHNINTLFSNFKMGLAAARNKQRFGLDPRNTTWSNNTSRFGHKHLEKLGWKPGSGLGLVPDSTTSHIKVSIKDDNLGLGAKLKKKEKQDEFDSGECTGLDVFQRLLGRLNGNEQTISDELDKQRTDNIINGKWGIHFVKGEVLASTWDAENKQLISYSMGKKRPVEGSSDSEVSDRKKTKKVKKEKKVKKVKKEKKEKKEKKDKKEKKVKKEKEKKEKKLKDKHSKDTNEITRDQMLKPRDSAAVVPDAVSTRLSVRAKWIRQKRAAVMDAKALNEIFMVTD